MNRQEIKAKVDAFLVGELEIDEAKISDDALLKKDLGIDSLDLVDIIYIILFLRMFRIKRRYRFFASCCVIVLAPYMSCFFLKFFFQASRMFPASYP